MTLVWHVASLIYYHDGFLISYLLVWVEYGVWLVRPCRRSLAFALITKLYLHVPYLVVNTVQSTFHSCFSTVLT